jgi:hypothetical protein
MDGLSGFPIFRQTQMKYKLEKEIGPGLQTWQSAFPDHACAVLLPFFAGPEYGQFLMLFILHHHCPSCFGWCNEPCHHLDRAAPKPPGQHSNSHDLCSLPVMVGTAQTWCQNTMAHLQIDDHPITYLRRFPKSWGYPQIIQIGPYLSIF